MKIVSSRPVANGFEVEVEIPNAYTDGKSRFERFQIGARQDATKAEIAAAIANALRMAADLRGADVPDAPSTKAELEPLLQAPYERWKRWHDTHAEAVARGGLPAAVITALQNRRNDAWTAYLDALNRWRAAP